METAEIVKTENGVAETTPATLIQLAIQQPNFDIEKLEKLLQLQERWQANIARKEFFEALANFQAACPVITKDKKAGFQSKTGGPVGYSYATLGQIIAQLREPLKNHGLSYRWEFSELEKTISVKCLITHKSGHSESTIMSGSADNSGAKNDIQARGSTLTYLQRYTLIGALGIGTAQDDVDGEKKKEQQKPEVISPDLQNKITGCKTEETLKAVWNENKDLWNKPFFKTAVSKRLKEIKYAVLPEKIILEINEAEAEENLNAIFSEYVLFQSNIEFLSRINVKRVEISNYQK